MRQSASRAFRVIGSVLFVAAGLAYTFLPPRTTVAAFDGRWPALVYGIVFIVGGLISLYGVLARFTQIERFGVVLVVIAGAVLTGAQTLIMFDAPVTWTRLGGNLVYAGFTVWAFERWWRLGADTQAIHELTDEGARHP